MIDRIARRLKILQDQIDAEKIKNGQPRDGLTTTTPVERHHAKNEEERKIRDFDDTQPATGIPLC